MYQRIMDSFVFLLCLISSVTAATINNCPAAKPCVCAGLEINCAGQNLSAVPPFGYSNRRYDLLVLSNNKITHIPPNSFAAINVTKIKLDHNRLSGIDDNAFAALTGSLKTLDLSHNYIQRLPTALSHLEKLEELDVAWNPIQQYSYHRHPDGLTDSVMRQLGDSLYKFAFGDSSYTTWPKTLNHLNQLKELRVSGSNYSYWPPDCFHGFEHTLENLTIEYAALAAIPIGITRLTRIGELHLDHLHVPGLYGGIPFTDGSLIQAPFHEIANTLHTLSLNYDGLTEFPEVIHDLRNLRSLSLDGNNLRFISDEAITLLKNANVTTLSLKDCNLKRVPGAISDVQHLLNLDLSHNKMRSVESTDLQNLQHLTTLSMSNNPLKYFSNNSLCGMDNLQTLQLHNTSLTELPKSFQHLSSLVNLDLSESRIDCTCDLFWIDLWQDKCRRTNKINIQGRCETIDMEIQKYIDQRLHTCPDYIHTSASNIRCVASCSNTTAGAGRRNTV